MHAIGTNYFFDKSTTWPTRGFARKWKLWEPVEKHLYILSGQVVSEMKAAGREIQDHIN